VQEKWILTLSCNFRKNFKLQASATAVNITVIHSQMYTWIKQNIWDITHNRKFHLIDDHISGWFWAMAQSSLRPARERKVYKVHVLFMKYSSPSTLIHFTTDAPISESTKLRSLYANPRTGTGCPQAPSTENERTKVTMAILFSQTQNSFRKHTSMMTLKNF